MPAVLSQLSIATDRSVADCVYRLRSLRNAPEFARFADVAVSDDGGSVQLWMRWTWRYGNAYSPYFVGQLDTHQDGATLVGVVRLPRFAAGFLSAWFFAALAGGCLMCVLSFSGKPARLDGREIGQGYLVGIACAMIAMAYVARSLMLWPSRREARWLADMLTACIARR